MLDKLDDILYRVEKPGRYIGEEINMVEKDLGKVTTRFGFAFPDIYEVGMSYLGLHIIYGLMNEREDLYCERIFSPWVDMEAEMRKEEMPLFTLETKTPIKELDIIGITLQYELSYTNILNLMDLGNIPLRTSERTEDDPIIFAGGPCAYNPEPLAGIIDFFIMGEGEDVLNEVMDEMNYKKENGLTKAQFLERIVKIEGIYIPEFYEIIYKEDKTIEEMRPLKEGYPVKVKKRIMKDMNESYYPEKFIVPYLEVVHGRVMTEIFRGCTRGCRFCQAGMIYRPVREKSPEKIIESSLKLLETTGYEELSLTSLSTLDHTAIKQIVTTLMEKNSDKKIGLSLPSLRLDSFSMEILQEIQKIRKTGLTFAPEAGTQRMRDVINKGVTEDNLFDTLTEVFNLGWSKVKLYFMIGLPYETDEDIEGIAKLGQQALGIYRNTPKENRGRGGSITLSASCFVPKPFTPFQWFAQNPVDEFSRKAYFLKDAINSKHIKYQYHDSKTSYLEGVFARGDRRLSEVLIKAFELGCKFDGWGEYFDFDAWMKAFEELGVDPDFYNLRERDYEEILPWDFIDVGVTKKFLIRENEKAKNGETTGNCMDTCGGCGVNTGFLGGLC
ncbi:MAG: TIGR03960 family B12-binding radical SAM protein [Firmicutes bacterium]|jgi:radical SAM family uncharacterized protein|nr:TIGR03960 family B12-binding radical SAM protein [Bacillota bacterium]